MCQGLRKIGPYIWLVAKRGYSENCNASSMCSPRQLERKTSRGKTPQDWEHCVLSCEWTSVTHGNTVGSGVVSWEHCVTLLWGPYLLSCLLSLMLGDHLLAEHSENEVSGEVRQEHQVHSYTRLVLRSPGLGSPRWVCTASLTFGLFPASKLSSSEVIMRICSVKHKVQFSNEIQDNQVRVQPKMCSEALLWNTGLADLTSDDCSLVVHSWPIRTQSSQLFKKMVNNLANCKRGANRNTSKPYNMQVVCIYRKLYSSWFDTDHQNCLLDIGGNQIIGLTVS